MLANGIEDLRKLHRDFKRKVHSYIEQLDRVHGELKKQAEALLKDDMDESLDSKGRFEDKTSKSPAVIAAINQLGERVTANDVLELIKKNRLADHVKDRDVRRVLSRIAKRDNSPLKLIEKGKGTSPNIYKKTRPVEP